MNPVKDIIEWVISLVYQASDFVSYLTKPIFQFGSASFSPIGLITLTGLGFYISIAVVKWLAS